MNTEMLRTCSLEFSQRSIEEKTVMFIENHFNGARGLISKIFRTYLSLPLYKDHKFVWVARDYAETLKIFGSLIDDPRIWICVSNGYDYVRYLNTAKYLITAAYLPSFYMKRNEQVIYYALPELYIHKKVYFNTMLLRLCPTLNNADRVLIEEDTEPMRDFAERFGITGKLKLVNFRQSEEDASIKKEKNIFVSMTDNKKAVKSLAVFQYVYDTVTSIAEAYGYKVYWKISLTLYRRYIDDEMSLIAFKNINSNEYDCRKYLENADIIISDNYTDVLTADRYCDNVIFYCNDSMDYEEFKTKGKILRTSDYSRLLDILEMKLEGRDTIEDTVDTKKVPVLFDCPGELCGDSSYSIYENRYDAGTETGEEQDRGSRVLIVLDVTGDESSVINLREMLDRYKNKLYLTVFFCTASGGKLYNYLDEMYSDIPYACRAGAIRCSEEEKKEVLRKIDWNKEKEDLKRYNREKKTLCEEWTRILGKVKYDHAVVLSGINNFWNNMIRFTPAKKIKFVGKKSKGEETIAAIKNELDKLI